MKRFAPIYGDYSPYHGDYTIQRLTAATDYIEHDWGKIDLTERYPMR